MKKVTIVLVLACMVLVGCGSKREKVVCSMEDKETNVGYTLKTEVTGYLEGDLVVSEESKTVMTFEDEELAKSTKPILEEQLKEDGARVSLVDKIITVTTSQNYQDPIPKQDFMDTYTVDQYTCE